MLFSSIATVRSGVGEQASRGLEGEEPRKGCIAGFAAFLVRARLLLSTLLALSAVLGAAFSILVQGHASSANTLGMASLCVTSLLAVALLGGEALARRRVRALTSFVGGLAGVESVAAQDEGRLGEIGHLRSTVDAAATLVQERIAGLVETEAQFRALLGNLQGVSYIYNASEDGGPDVLYISPQVERLLGFTPGEWLADSALWSRQLYPEDKARVLAAYAAACEGGHSFLCEYRMLAKGGSPVWLRDEAHITRGGSGNNGLMLGMMLDITAQRKSQATLQEAGDRYAGILEEAREAVVSVDAQGSINLFNRAAQALLGYDERELLGKPLTMLWCSDQAEAYSRLVQELAAGGERPGGLVASGEMLLRRKDGPPVPAEATVSQAVRGAQTMTTLVMRDITQRRLAEGQLRSSEASFRAMFGDNPLPMWVYDLDTLQFLEVNAAAQARYGYSRPEFLSMRVGDLKAQEDVGRLVDGNAQRQSDGQYSIELRHRRKDGQAIDVQLASQTLDFAGRRAALVVAEEITERKRAEEALRDSEQRFRAMFEGAAIGVALVDLDGRYIKANPALVKMLGYAGDELCNVSFAEITHPDDRSRGLAPFQQLVEGKKDYYHIEGRFIRKDGGVMWANLTVSLVRGSKRRPQFCIAMVEDITERKRSQEQIKRQLERLAALRNIDLTISSSLDLRVTLNVILEQVMSQLHVDATDVLLLNPHTQMLEYAAGRGFRFEGIARSRLRMGEGHAGRAALERRTLTVPNLDAELELGRAHLLAGEDFVSYYAVPLLVKGQVKGVLEIFNRSALSPQLEWLDFLEALTSQAAIAIDNATMFDQLQRSNSELALAYDTTLEGWSHALDLRDEETEGHTQRVTDMADRLARAMGVGEAELVHVHRGALLHDIGKMGIPDSILLKPGPLTDEEWVIMRRHPVYAYELLSPISFLRPSLDIPYCHHEKWDGTGYPRGLKGEQIPLSARIFAVADVYDALSSDRPYRKAWPESKVRDHIRALSGSHFDPQVVDAFLRMDVPAAHPTIPLGGLWEYVERKLVEEGELGKV